MAKIIGVWNKKGGVGKSTTAYFLAGYLASGNGSVNAGRILLLDTDDRQHSCVAMAEWARDAGINIGFDVGTPENSSPAGYDTIIIDMPGLWSDWHEIAQAVIVPRRYGRLDFAMGVESATQIQAPTIDMLLFDRAKPEQRAAAETLGTKGWQTVGLRSVVGSLSETGAHPWAHSLPYVKRFGLADVKEDYRHVANAALRAIK